MSTLRRLDLERRCAVREPLAPPARLVWSLGGAQLTDLSPHGAGLRLAASDAPLVVGATLRVTAVAEFLRFGPFEARVIWTRHERAGLLFREPSSPQLRALRDLLTPPLQGSESDSE